MKKIVNSSISDLLGRVLLAFGLFYGVARTLWSAFALDSLKSAWTVQIFAGAVLFILLCSVTGKRTGIFVYIFIAAFLAVAAIAASRYISDGWSVVFNRIFSGFELRYGRIFPYFKAGLTKAKPDLCAALFLLYPTTLLALCSARAVCMRSVWRFAFPVVAILIWIAAIAFKLPVSGLPPVLFAFALAAMRTRSITLKTTVPDGGRSILPVALALALLIGVLALPAAVLAGNREQSAAGLRDRISLGLHDKRYHVAESPMPEGDFTKLGNFEPEEGTALRVTMDEPRIMYLRGYIGDVYTSDGWKRLEPKTLGRYATLFSWMHTAGFYGQTQYASAAAALAGGTGSEKIRIENISACSDFEFIPYNLETFSGRDAKNTIGDSFVRSKGLRGERTYEYGVSDYAIENYADLYAMLLDKHYSGSGPGQEYLRYESAYREFVYKEYLTVPSGVGADLRKLNEFSMIPQDVKVSFKDARGIVLTCLLNNFEYDEHPGKTPKGWDCTRWFIDGSKRGYAPHFATAAVLMFRELGIPARYVEGYAVREKEVGAAQGGQIEVPDANAHAWVETYRDGVGWIPFEVTPPFVTEMPEAAGGNSGGNGSSDIEPDPGVPPVENAPLTLAQILMILLAALFLLLIAVLMYLFFRRRAIMKRRGRLLEDPDNAEAVCWLVAYAVMLLGHIGVKRENRSLFELAPETECLLGTEFAAAFTAVVSVQREAMFARKPVDDLTRDTVRAFAGETIKKLKETCGMKKRLYLKWILCAY